MSAPHDVESLKKLQAIAEENIAAGDWKYSSTLFSAMPTRVKEPVGELLKTIGAKRLPKRNR